MSLFNVNLLEYRKKFRYAMKTVDIIERIEGEAHLKLGWENGIVTDSRIEFLNFRGFEYILEGKAPLDALIYTPRICGICGQAHLLSTVNALENLYKNAQIELDVPTKAKQLRELGLAIEILDSHIKWFYMFIMPDVASLSKGKYKGYEPLKGDKWLNAIKVASETMKGLAIIGGQWPHTSYMIPGGVMCDPTLMELATVDNYMDQAIMFFENNLSGVPLSEYLQFNSISDLDNLSADLKEFKELSFEHNLNSIGKSYGKFFVISDMLGFKSGRIKLTNSGKINREKIKEYDEFSFDATVEKQHSKKYSWAKTVKYDEEYFETGPLSRAMIGGRKFVRSIHKEYQDSVFTRVMARMDEIAFLLQKCKKIIKSIDISEPSFIKPPIKLKDIHYSKAQGVVEASRGSLIHEVEIEKGKIKSYNVITPTVWNLGPGSKLKPGVAQKAILGSKSVKEATIILRSFDVCSVCTTH